MSEEEILKYLDSIKFYNYTTCLDPVDTDLGKLQRKEKRALKIARSCVVENKKLQQENQQLKEQLEFERQCQNRFFKVNNKTYDGKIVLAQLKQRDEVIDEAIKTLYKHKHYTYPDEIQNKFNEDIVIKTYDILQRYRGDNK